jgi:flagellar hook-associated protein 3 FlgL
MRVNPNPTPDLLAALAQTQLEQETALAQLASGSRVNQPSDDPAAAAVLAQNRAQSDQADQFLRSIGSVQGQLQTADGTLSSVLTALERAISLGVEGANGTQTDANRSAIIGELQGLQDQLIGLANTTFQGRYLFGGTTQALPYSKDSSAPSGVRYDGNDGANSVIVGTGLSVQMNLPGSQVFSQAGHDVFQSMADLMTALTTGTGMDTAVANVRDAFDYVSAHRVFYGNNMNQLESQQNFLNSEKVQLSQQENIVGGTDTTAAVTRLINAQNARNATLAAAGRVSQSSLFDYLK